MELITQYNIADIAGTPDDDILQFIRKYKINIEPNRLKMEFQAIKLLRNAGLFSASDIPALDDDEFIKLYTEIDESLIQSELIQNDVKINPKLTRLLAILIILTIRHMEQPYWKFMMGKYADISILDE